MDQLDKLTTCLRIEKECRVHAAVAEGTLRGVASIMDKHEGGGIDGILDEQPQPNG